MGLRFPRRMSLCHWSFTDTRELFRTHFQMWRPVSFVSKNPRQDFTASSSVTIFALTTSFTMWEKPPFEALLKALDDPSNPIGMRMRAAYHLRQEHRERPEKVVDALSRGLLDEHHGSLMRHEFAYIMGQLRDERCCETLESVLKNDADDVMVRHEASEALGAIGAHRSVAVLQRVLECEQTPAELAETCQLALNVMKWVAEGEDPATMPAACACMLNPYSSVDPAPAHPAHAELPMEELGDILCNVDLPLFERYRAMFSLRNLGGEGAVLQLCRALVSDISSALLRHEVAYVLGQMQHPASVDALEDSLRRVNEHSMVRHESAEALGAIDGGRWDDVERILNEFTKDDDIVVRESCLVALDAADYWGRSSGNDDSQEKHDEKLKTSVFANEKAEQRKLVDHFNVIN